MQIVMKIVDYVLAHSSLIYIIKEEQIILFTIAKLFSEIIVI